LRCEKRGGSKRRRSEGTSSENVEVGKASKRDTRAPPYVLVDIFTPDGSCQNTEIQLLSFVHVLLLSPPLTFLNFIFPRW
jgi:hypothetical protein